MFSTDQSHLRRYLTTLGVAIAAGTLSLAGLFFKLQQDLLVTRATLNTLTPSARDAVMKRQEYLAIGTTILPWFTLIGFCCGLAMAVYGVIGWASRQKVIDLREDIGLQKEEFELSHLTAAQQADKIDREAGEAVAEVLTVDREEVVEGISETADREAEEPVEETVHENLGEEAAETTDREAEQTVGVLPTSLTRRADFAEARSSILMSENALREKLIVVFGEDQVATNIITSNPTNDKERIEIDAAVILLNRRFAFEVKYVSSEKNARYQIIDGLQRLARVSEGGFTGVLVVILSDGAGLREVAEWHTIALQLASAYVSAPSVYVGRYSNFLAQPAYDFVAEIGLKI